MGIMALGSKLSLSAFLILLTFIISRVLFLTDIPIFTDEAIYLRWAQIARGDFDWILISLTDGKGPLFIWLVMVLMNFFADPLVAGRMVSVASGIGTLAGLYYLSTLLFKNQWIGIAAALLYTILPFTLVYDRLAIYDSFVAALYIWGIYWTVKLTQKPSFSSAIISGGVISLGVLTKSSAFFVVYLLPLLFILLNFGNKNFVSKAKKWLIFMGFAVLIVYGIYHLQRISPAFYLIAQKNEVFVYSLSEWIQNPFAYLWANLLTLSQWLVGYMTLPIVGLIIAAFGIRKDNLREKLLLVMYCVLPFIALALFAKLLYPRYILFMSVALIPLAAYSIVVLYSVIKNRAIYWMLIGVVLAFPLYSSFQVLRDFEHAPIPGTDKGQFLTGWPSGVGVQDSVEFFRAKSANEKIFVGVGGQFGLLPAGLELYLHSNSNVEIVGYWPITETPQEEILKKAQSKPAYFMFYQPCGACEYEGDAPDTWPVERIVEYKKPGEHAVLSIYKVIPQL